MEIFKRIIGNSVITKLNIFFRCRMNKDLMEKQELKNLGLQNIPEKKTWHRRLLYNYFLIKYSNISKTLFSVTYFKMISQRKHEYRNGTWLYHWTRRRNWWRCWCNFYESVRGEKFIFLLIYLYLYTYLFNLY